MSNTTVEYDDGQYLLAEDETPVLQENGEELLLEPQSYRLRILETGFLSEITQAGYKIIVEETYKIKESLLTTWSFILTFTDSFSLTDNFLTHLFITVKENLSIKESLIASAKYFLTLVDKINIFDSFLGSWWIFDNRVEDTEWTFDEKSDDVDWEYDDENNIQTKL